MDIQTKKDIRAILLSYGKPCAIRELSKLYLEIAGEEIDFRKSGFASLENCLLGMPDVRILRFPTKSVIHFVINL